MNLALDPFQIVRSVPAGRIEVTPPNQNLEFDDLGTYSFSSWCDGSAACKPTFSWGVGYEVGANFRLSAPLQECAQTDWIITGQTSGKSVNFGAVDYLAAKGFDCFSPKCGGCEAEHKTGQVFSFRELYTGRWQLFGVWYLSVGLNLWLRDPSGFTAGETFSVSFPVAPKRTITAITERSPSGVWVAVEGDLQPDESWVTIAGTVNYNGGFMIHDPAAGRFWIDTTHIADEATGSVQAKYDGPTS